MSSVPQFSINDETPDRSNMLLPNHLAVISETTGLRAERFEEKEIRTVSPTEVLSNTAASPSFIEIARICPPPEKL